ncbi:MAG: hypothetical protein K0S07_1057 [Chlamydiales bacterium]|nr:hypothetical protein [Chlamydiales bacterium]
MDKKKAFISKDYRPYGLCCISRLAYPQISFSSQMNIIDSWRSLFQYFERRSHRASRRLNFLCTQEKQRSTFQRPFEGETFGPGHLRRFFHFR